MMKKEAERLYLKLPPEIIEVLRKTAAKKQKSVSALIDEWVQTLKNKSDISEISDDSNSRIQRLSLVVRPETLDILKIKAADKNISVCKMIKLWAQTLDISNDKSITEQENQKAKIIPESIDTSLDTGIESFAYKYECINGTDIDRIETIRELESLADSVPISKRSIIIKAAAQLRTLERIRGLLK